MKKVLTKKSFVFCFLPHRKQKRKSMKKRTIVFVSKLLFLFFGAVLKKHTQYDIINTKTGRKTNG